jgi:hypothetical protein
VAVPVHIAREPRFFARYIGLIVLLTSVEQAVLAGRVVCADLGRIVAWMRTIVVVQALGYLRRADEFPRLRAVFSLSVSLRALLAAASGSFSRHDVPPGWDRGNRHAPVGFIMAIALRPLS